MVIVSATVPELWFGVIRRTRIIQPLVALGRFTRTERWYPLVVFPSTAANCTC
ncbi:hypothetical protein D3C81_2233700 [compost metagenome]